MVRKVLLWFGIFLILAGMSLPLYVNCVSDYSQAEWRPIDVVVNTAGQETSAEFTATRQSGYSVAISIPAPRGASDDDVMHKYACMIRSPGCHWENDQCRVSGLLRVSEIRLNNIAKKDESADCHYGVNERGPKRDLFDFDAIPGRHYVITTKVSADDASLAKLGPRLVVDRSPPWMAEKEDQEGVGSIVGFLSGCLIGIPCIILSLRWKRKPKPETVAKE